MKNQILEAGDLVKYNTHKGDFEDFGFEVGDVFRLQKGNQDALFFFGGVRGARIELVDSEGKLTDYGWFFTKVEEPVILPVGAQNEKF